MLDLFIGKKNETVKVRQVKVTAKDVEGNIRRIMDKMESTPIQTAEYDRLQEELKKEIENLKRIKEANQVISLKDGMVIGGTAIALVFFIALAREYPSALKVASTILKFVPFKGL